MDTKILIELGLTKDEAGIYAMLLKDGPSPARIISFKTDIGRQLTYKVLDDLIKKELVNKKESSKITLFSPTHPRKLESFFEKQKNKVDLIKKELEENIGNMISSYNLFSGKPNVQFYEGEEGIKRVLEDTLNLKEGNHIYTYVDLEAILKYIPKINEDYSKKREKLGIKKMGLMLDSPKSRSLIKNYLTGITETKFLKFNIIEFETIMQIYENKISYITLKEDSMIGVIIEDSSIYKMHKSIFEYLWGITPKEQNNS